MNTTENIAYDFKEKVSEAVRLHEEGVNRYRVFTPFTFDDGDGFSIVLQNDDKCRDVTISLHQFEKWGIPFRSLAIFENQTDINRKVLARFSDVSDKQFSSLVSNRERIHNYLEGAVK